MKFSISLEIFKILKFFNLWGLRESIRRWASERASSVAHLSCQERVQGWLSDLVMLLESVDTCTEDVWQIDLNISPTAVDLEMEASEAGRVINIGKKSIHHHRGDPSFLGLSPDPEITEQKKAMVYTTFLGKQGKRVYTTGPERRVYTIEPPGTKEGPRAEAVQVY